ncbi:MAG: CRISPR-associated protein Cas4 [Proteobacteria bacterium]|nr:CRISPR-associated protein Cas4 [Pseudomonadota bacterium]
MDDSINIGLINSYLYCKRRAGLIAIEQVFSHNHHTIKGKHLHERVDKPGSHRVHDKDCMRSLYVWSRELGIRGRCDVVERHGDGSLVPIEYKKGAMKAYINDDVQLCAQVLCLEAMFDVEISHGFIYHASSKRRRKVDLTEKLRGFTRDTINEMHQFLRAQQVPSAIHSNKCPGCSVNQHCLPEVTDRTSWHHKKNSLFTPRDLKESY